MSFMVNLYLLVIISHGVTAGVFSWLWNTGKGENSGPEKMVTVPPPRGKVPFEMTTTDDKFLAEAQFTKELSPLDLCHHMVSISPRNILHS